MNYEENNRYVHDYEDSGRPIPSTKIGYDNTDSGLDAINVQGAIDEVAQILDEKQDKAYDGTESGIEADTVTGAIDELAQDVSDLTDVVEEEQEKLNNLTAEDVAYVNTASGLSATDVQNAIDELDDIIDDLEGYSVKTIETVILPNCITYPSLVEHIKSDIEAIITAQPNNEKLVILGLTIDGFGFFSYYGSRSLWANNTSTTYLGTMFTRVRNDASTVVIETMSGVGCRRATIGDSSFVAKDFVVDESTTAIVTKVQVLRLKAI